MHEKIHTHTHTHTHTHAYKHLISTNHSPALLQAAILKIGKNYKFRYFITVF